MAGSDGIQWTNKSVLRLAKNQDPIAVIERMARELVLRARDQGWQGPPFNPVAIANLLKIPVDANADVADARTIASEGGLRIQFNPTQPRERVRFSIAHELAHTLFPDVADAVRHRATPTSPDDWQLEMLCNLAAAEFVMPLGSLPPRDKLPAIEALKSKPRVKLAKHVPQLKPFMREAQEILEGAFLRGTRILLEGTQGTSLSMHHGA